MPRVLIICHEPEAAPGIVGELLREQGHVVDEHVVLADPERPDVDFPAPDGYDAVIAFGSFANAYDEAVRHWVDAEVRLLASLVEKDIPYLGMCFGGQLLAEALGGRVEPAPPGEEEVGLVSFDLAPDAPRLPEGPWFSWHHDRVQVPDDVEILGRNANAVQLFRRGRAVGTQFHPEVTPALVASWVAMGPEHVPDYTTGERLVDDLERAEAVLRRNCQRFVDWFAADVAGLRG